MAYSKKEYQGDGAKTTFQIPFPYLRNEDIGVTVNGVVTSYTWANSSAVTLSSAPASGAVVYVERATEKDTKLIDFVDGAIFSEDDLDTSFLQSFYIMQEVLDVLGTSLKTDPDGKMDAQNRVIKNLADGVSPKDAVNVGQLGTHLQETKSWADHAHHHDENAEKMKDEATAVRNQLYDLSTQVHALPTGSYSPKGTYDAAQGLLEIWVGTGPSGATGATGALGPVGPTGLAGPRGPQGIQGDDGVRGQTGNDGPLGPTGAVGPRGIQGLLGAVGPTGSTGPKGEQGNKGDTGSRGPTGLQGPVGTQGPIGAIGNTGSTGATGAIGVTGVKGATGSTGVQGPVGLTGSTGPIGPQGVKGATGSTGVQGPQGLTGNTGPLGPQGIQGTKGDKGDLGNQGTAGPVGLKGPTGNMGATPMALAFGRFEVNDAGELVIEHYGNASSNDFKINSNGDLEVTV